MHDFVNFHHIVHISISLIGGLTLLSIYRNITQRFSDVLSENDDYSGLDKGLFFLSMGLMVWVFAGLWSLQKDAVQTLNPTLYHLGHASWSILNNLFLLLALTYFEEAPQLIRERPKKIMAIVVLTFISAFLLPWVPGTSANGTSSVAWMVLPDFLLSCLVSILLMITLFRTFQKRDLPLIAIISVLSVGLILYSQLPELFPQLTSGFVQLAVKLIAKTVLIFVFLVLATTWVIRLAHTPRLNELSLRFRDWSDVVLRIPSKHVVDQQVDFGSKTVQFINLAKFALRRKYGHGPNQNIEVGGWGEIKSQTYISRIIDNLNDQLPLEPEDKLERGDLFTFLGEGRYRLRILPEHIHFEDYFLEELLADLPEAYGALVSKELQKITSRKS